MIDLKITEQELNTILHGLYILEDQSWFIGKDVTESLITKLNAIDATYQAKNETLCDI